MSCDGYEHGSRVVLLHGLPGSKLQAGIRGEVVRVDTHQHTLDVKFEGLGLVRTVDAHAVALDSEKEPPTGESTPIPM